MLTISKANEILAGFSLAVGLLFLSGLVCSSNAAEGSFSVTVTTNYYVFGGTNRAQLFAAMAAARPWKEAMPYDAQTKWSLHSNYGYGYDRAADQYKLNWVEVKGTVVITLPRWIPGHPVKPDLVARWVKCVAGLSTHERGHLQLAQAATAEAKRRLVALPACDTPQELVALIRQTLNDTLDDYRARENKYDEVTGHGWTQGAIFARGGFGIGE